MGLGKTIITLSLLNALETTYTEFFKRKENAEEEKSELIEKEPEFGISLLVCPATLQD